MNKEMHIVTAKRDIQTLQNYLDKLLECGSFMEKYYSEDETLNKNNIVNGFSEAKQSSCGQEKNFFLNDKQVIICFSKITQIPNAIFDLKYLTELNLSNNSFEILPEEIGSLCNLLTLKAFGNKLNSLPKSLKQIRHLSYLDISCNNFFEVPDVLLYGLWFLKVLNMSSNKITNFNDAPGCLNKLIVLNLSDNLLKELPMWILDNLCQLQFLDISKNNLCLSYKLVHYFSTGIFESLQLLNIENCNISLDKIHMFSFLKNLDVAHLGNKSDVDEKLIGNNYFGNLNMEEHKMFKNIKCLYMQNIQVCILPSDLDYLKNIQLLDLSNNLIPWLPECFCNLFSLKIVNLTSNKLLFLPSNIGNLMNLQQLLLGNNRLNQIPESFYNLNKLEFVDLYNNQIETIHLGILSGKNLKGIDLGMNYLQFDVGSAMNMMYASLKDSFRNHFCYTECRSDLQMSRSVEELDEQSDLHSYSSKSYISSCMEEDLSDLEDSFVNVTHQSCNKIEDWENECLDESERDESFDPNNMDPMQQFQRFLNLDFRDNFCPAKYHTPSVMKKYVKNFQLTFTNETAEGQFDSD